MDVVTTQSTIEHVTPPGVTTFSQMPDVWIAGVVGGRVGDPVAFVRWLEPAICANAPDTPDAVSSSHVTVPPAIASMRTSTDTSLHCGGIQPIGKYNVEPAVTFAPAVPPVVVADPAPT